MLYYFVSVFYEKLGYNGKLMCNLLKFRPNPVFGPNRSLNLEYFAQINYNDSITILFFLLNVECVIEKNHVSVRR